MYYAIIRIVSVNIKVRNQFSVMQEVLACH